MELELHQTKQLLDWYDRTAQSFLEKTIPAEKIAEFNKDREILLKAVQVADDEVAVCFLGASGIGKSTLINAMVGGAQAVVPAGGVGPLTAQALVVRSRLQRGLEVEYHRRGRILNMVFGLEQMFKADLGSAAESDALADLADLEEDELPEESADLAADDEGEPETEANADRLEKREQFRRSAQLLVTGNQDVDRELKYLLDSLREVAGGKRIWGTAPDPADAERLDGIRRALSLANEGQTFSLDSFVSDTDFRKSLHDHATGYLAPLIKNLTLDWPNSKLAGGITFVDLPGVGVVRDVHADVTRKWIREKAQALVLVVDHRGMTEPLAEALRRSEFLNSLLYSADEPEDDPIVLVAITRIDDLAGEHYRQYRDQNPDGSKRKFEFFRELVEEARERLRNELQRRLEEIWLNDPNVSDARRQVVHNLLSTLQIHPISAPEYRKLLAGDDEDERPFLKELEQTGVPELVESIETLARHRRGQATARLKARATIFRDQLATTLKLIEAQWESESRAEGEAAKLRSDLENFIQVRQFPLREELANRQGAYRAFLKKTIPQRVEDLMQTAKAKASKDIDRYLARLWQSHWMTLRASVRRGGRYSGASDINLPTEFALRFEEPIAEAWGTEILKDIRRETKDYADDCVRIVEEVAEWALGQGARVQPALIEAQRDAIRADAKKLQSVGREMVKEMRDEAKAQLVNAIEAPIKSACFDFVRRKSDIGPGVKQRILELYEQLSDKVTEAAEAPAKKILLKLFRDVEKEILAAFDEWQNPLNTIIEAIVVSQQKYLERSDAQRRKKILGELSLVLSAMPGAEQTNLAAQ